MSIEICKHARIIGIGYKIFKVSCILGGREIIPSNENSLIVSDCPCPQSAIKNNGENLCFLWESKEKNNG